MSTYYDRYSKYRINGSVGIVPFIKIKNSSSDIYIRYDRSKMRLDTLSYKYYGDPNYGWLIMQANPSFGCYEFSIPDFSDMRIPYPLDNALKRYEDEIQRISAVSD